MNFATKITVPQWLYKQDLRKLMEILPGAKIVGGAVRNSLLKLDITDIDIATDLLPDTVSYIASQHGFQVIPTGIAHGTVTCVKDGSYEVTTLRIDRETDGRHAVVEFSDSWEADARRRDFTINALYADFEGNIFDYVGGIKDLNNRLLKFIGNPEDRIKEDYLRILRFFRFYSHYCEGYDYSSLEACKKLSSGLQQISRERCTYEFIKMLQASDPWKAVDLLTPDILRNAGLPYDDRLDHLRKAEVNFNRKASYLGRAAAFKSAHEMLLSRHQSKCINMLHGLKDMLTLADYVIWINKAPEEIMWDGILLRGQPCMVPYLEPWIHNKFPLKGRDILELGFSPGPEIQVELDKAMDFFAKQPKPLSKSELIKEIYGQY